MKIILNTKERLEISFSSSEEVFEISTDKNDKVTIIQTAGYEIYQGSDNEPDHLVIYEGEIQTIDIREK